MHLWFVVALTTMEPPRQQVGHTLLIALPNLPPQADEMA